MAEKTTIARPYAQAVFDLACEQNRLADWNDMLSLLGLIASDPAMTGIVNNPLLSAQQLAQLFIDVSADHLDDGGKNFLRLLAENRRLNVLPEITLLFEAQRDEHEGRIEATIISALPVSDAQRDTIAAALKKRLGREVVLKCETDKNLLGGAIVKAGDLVIDGTAQGRLEKLAVSLSN